MPLISIMYSTMAKKQGFNFSGGTSFVFDNNAYYGTAPTSKEKNPIILTEYPFVGEAPSLDRMGNFKTGVLLEANGLRVKGDSPQIGAGISTYPNGISIDDGLKSKGQRLILLRFLRQMMISWEIVSTQKERITQPLKKQVLRRFSIQLRRRP